jgi:type III secretion system FlhB-like substrate exporter
MAGSGLTPCRALKGQEKQHRNMIEITFTNSRDIDTLRAIVNELRAPLVSTSFPTKTFETALEIFAFADMLEDNLVEYVISHLEPFDPGV